MREADNHAANEAPRRRLAAGTCIEPIVERIRKMRVHGLADNEIAALLRHAADELDEGKVNPAS